MRWTTSQLLRPIVFTLAVVAAILTGNRTSSFWYGFLAFFIAMGCGRALRALVRGDLPKALYRIVWPAAVTGYAFLFSDLGLAAWATFFVSWIAASFTKGALRPFFPRQPPRGKWKVEWRSLDVDELLP